MTRYTPTELRDMAETAYELEWSDVAVSMLSQAADDAEDAERYRFARDHGKAFEHYYGCEYHEIDRTLDAARKETT